MRRETSLDTIKDHTTAPNGDVLNKGVEKQEVVKPEKMEFKITSSDIHRWLEEWEQVELVWEEADSDQVCVSFLNDSNKIGVSWGCPDTRSWAAEIATQITGQSQKFDGYDGVELPIPEGEWQITVETVEFWDSDTNRFEFIKGSPTYFQSQLEAIDRLRKEPLTLRRWKTSKGSVQNRLFQGGKGGEFQGDRWGEYILFFESTTEGSPITKFGDPKIQAVAEALVKHAVISREDEELTVEVDSRLAIEFANSYWSKVVKKLKTSLEESREFFPD